MGFIYKITNIQNKKCLIGQTVQNPQRRWKQHLSKIKTGQHPNKHFQAAHNKYGTGFFIFEVIDTSDDVFSLDNLERYWIDFYDSMNPNRGYNKRHGGHVNHWLSSETKKLMSCAAKKRNLDLSASKNPFYGKVHSQETRAKMSKMRIGKSISESTRRKLSQAKLGKLPNNARTVLCVNNGETYRSYCHAADELNCKRWDIAAVCNGVKPEIKGLIFKLLEDNK